MPLKYFFTFRNEFSLLHIYKKTAIFSILSQCYEYLVSYLFLKQQVLLCSSYQKLIKDPKSLVICVISGRYYTGIETEKFKMFSLLTHLQIIIISPLHVNINNIYVKNNIQDKKES